MSARLAFDVAGDPVPQGSTRSFARNGRQVTTSDPSGRIERWRGDVRSAAKAVLPAAWEPLAGPVRIGVNFRFARPASHYLPVNSRRPQRVLRPDAPTWHDKAPDGDKCLRAVLDALTHVVYVDDRQVCSIVVSKLWSEYAGASIDISERLA